jgi:hypothetical protein
MAGVRTHYCIERIVPDDYVMIARRVALEENPANAAEGIGEAVAEAAAIKSKLWKTGRTLRARFLGGEPEVHRNVERYARQWSDHANIAFAFGDDPDAEIRIAFMPGDGSWSALGTDALVGEWFRPSEPTMNYGWLTPDSTEEEIARVVLHEFGHALGMIHEHQSPAAGIRWNREAVIRDLSGPPNNWDPETIEHNVFGRYASDQTQFTAFDPASIMLYSFPTHWTVDGQELRENDRLSASDIAFIAASYPPA